MTNLSLLDLVLPYMLSGQGLGPWHAALGAIMVDWHESAMATEGVALRGRARFDLSAQPYIDPARGRIGFRAKTGGTHPHDDPSRRDPWLDLRDAGIDFELHAPRRASPIVAAAAMSPGPLANVLAALDPPPLDVLSDYVSTEFTLDMVLTSLALRPPLLRGARLRPDDGLLEPDEANPDVAFWLPRLKLRLQQNPAGVLTLDLLSVGSSGLDDAGDLGVAEMIRMEPPYAFIGDSRVVGFGFRRAVLDLSEQSTPPEVLEQFGYDESWKGLYLPEIRLFVAPHGMRDLAVSAGARNLLIGLGNTPGVTGDFDLSIINQGGAMSVSARFFAAGNRVIGFTSHADGSASAALPQKTRVCIDATGARPPYVYQATLDGNALAAVGEPNVFDIDLGSRNSATLMLQASAGSSSATLTLKLTRRGELAQTVAGGALAQPGMDIHTDTVTMGGTAVSTHELTIIAQNAEYAVVALKPPHAQTQWTVNGTPSGPSISVQVPVAPGKSAQVKATVPGPAGGMTELECFFRFDRPTPVQHPHDGESGVSAATAAGLAGSLPPAGHSYCLDAGNSATRPAASTRNDAGFPGGSSIVQAYGPVLQSLPASVNVTIEGYASTEADPNDGSYNLLLSRRRAEAFAELIRAAAPGKSFSYTITGKGEHGDASLESRRQNWRAVARAALPPQPETLIQGRVTRGKNQPQPVIEYPRDPAPKQPATPDWFRALCTKVRIVRDEFVAVEICGEFDIQTPTESYLQAHGGAGNTALTGLGGNPADGILKARIIFQIDNATGNWSAQAFLGADPADRNGLFMLGQLPGQPLQSSDFGRNLLGMTVLFWPLLDATAPANPSAGNLAPAALSLAAIGVATALAEAGWFTVERVIWYGGELVIRQTQGTGTGVALLLDVETALSADVSLAGVTLLTIPREQPMVVRYKAIGMRFGSQPGERDFQFRPVFDSSRGYTIDLSSPGAIRVPDPLGQIVRILGARIARTNPLSFEFDLGFGVDLGVVSIDRARIRMTANTDGASPDFGVELTAFGASVDIPGALVGKGYMELGQEIGGQIDLTLVPISTRVCAGLKIAQIPEQDGGPATGVIVTLEVELPVCIPLANSGLGIYGFLGLFAMHYGRNESGLENSAVPALAWLKDRAEGNPTNLSAWKPEIDRWAFGVGAILGTVGTSVLLNLKGVLLLELPGPRILLLMKARMLQTMPALGDKNAEGNLLAVIDVDAAKGTLTVGLVADYTIDPLIKLRLPVEAFFNLGDSKDWHLYLGRYDDPVHASLFGVIEGSGYLMLSGNGIPAHGNLPAVQGFSIGTGLYASFTWGSVPARLYARIAGGFDAVVGFEPFRLSGTMEVRGELRLFIVSISAWARLTINSGEEMVNGLLRQLTSIDGEICGKVKFVFFSVKGCVHFRLGSTSTPSPVAPELVRDLKLVSRSPALVVGTGVDRGVDTGIGTGVRTDSEQPPVDLDAIPVVPIDAIPVLMMSAPPQADTLEIWGKPPTTPSGSSSDGWTRRGSNWYHYQLHEVLVEQPIGPGPAPSAWWTALKPTEENADVQLALLSWVPVATPKAFTRGRFQEETIVQRWGTVCHPAAPAASTLWTFGDTPLGTSAHGWNLTGQAWPDPPDTVRSREPDVALRITERWRCGMEHYDQMRGIIAANVLGVASVCPPPRRKEPQGKAPAKEWRPKQLRELLPEQPLSLSDVLARMQTGQSLSRADILTHAGTLATSQTGTHIPAEEQRTSQKLCSARALGAAMPDDKAPVVFGNPYDEEAIVRAWKLTGFEPGELGHALTLHSGSIVAGRALLLVSSYLLRIKALRICLLDKDGKTLGYRDVTNSDLVTVRGWPAEWTDPQSPWHDAIWLAARFMPSGAEGKLGGYVSVIVDLKGDPACHRVEIGLRRGNYLLDMPVQLVRPFYLCAIEMMRTGEMERHDYDETTVTRNRDAAAAVLGPDSANEALLLPDTLYRVEARWSGKVVYQDTRPTAEQAATLQATEHRSHFWFRTDRQPPLRLDPWVLVSLPTPDERHCFTGDPLSLVFATPSVMRLYEAYGKTLQVRIKAASFRHPPSTVAVPHPFPITMATVRPVAASIVSPFEEVLAELASGKKLPPGSLGLADARRTDPDQKQVPGLGTSATDTSGAGLPCIAVDEERIRHSRVDIPFALDPFTDYLVVVEMVDTQAGASGTPVEVWRRGFSTGAYASPQALSTAFLGYRPEHRCVRAGSIAGLAGTFPPGASGTGVQAEGADFDNALQACGIEPSLPPTQPRMVALWEHAGNDLPLPLAVLVDAPEPLYRTRMLPTRKQEQTPDRPSRWELESQVWLALDAYQPRPDEMPADDVFDRVIYAPGGQRAIVLLKPDSRGKALQLGLSRTRFRYPHLDGMDAVDESYKLGFVGLHAAPWEET